MNYKESLFLTGKILTISDNYEIKFLLEKELKSGNVNWKSVIRVSTTVYPLPYT